MAEQEVKEQQTPPSDEQKSEGEEPKQKKGFINSMSARERTIGFLALLGIVFLLADLVAFRPISRHLDELEQTINEKESVIPNKLKIFRHKKRIVGMNQELRLYLTDPVLSPEEEIAMFLREVERVSQVSGVFISNINPVRSEDLGSGGTRLVMDVEGVGGVETVKQFIVQLHESNPAIIVKGYNLRSQGPAVDELRYRFTISKLSLKETL